MSIELDNQIIEAHHKKVMETFEAAVKPVMKYLKDNHHPHMTIIVTSQGAELFENQMSIHIEAVDE